MTFKSYTSIRNSDLYTQTNNFLLKRGASQMSLASFLDLRVPFHRANFQGFGV
jgi:hypothetical protein